MYWKELITTHTKFDIISVSLSITDIWSNSQINLFSTNASFLYPLETLENLRFSGIFRGYKTGTFVINGLMWRTMEVSGIFRAITNTEKIVP